MRFPFLPLALAVLCTTLFAEPLDTLITAADLLKVRQLAAPTLSPDGKKIAYTVRSIETLPAGDFVYRDHLWLAATDGDEAPRELLLAGNNVHMPAWHPSGDRIAYVRPEVGGMARIWVLPVAGGEPLAVTPLFRGAAGPCWSPDGSRLLFTALVTYSEAKAALEKAGATASAPAWTMGKPEYSLAATPAPVPGAKKPDTPPAPDPDGPLSARLAWLAGNEARRDPIVVHRPRVSAGLAGETEPQFTHVFIIERAGTEPVDLTPGFLSRTAPAWTPDSQRIVCSGPADENLHPDRVETRRLLLLKADGSDLRTLVKSDAYSLDTPAVSPDGKLVACIAQPALEPGDLSYGQSRIAVIGLETGELRIVTNKLDRSAESVRWSPDGKYIYFIAETNGGVPLHRIPVSGGDHERISSPDTWVTGYSAGTDDVALVTARAGNPGELYRTRPNGKASRILTSHNSDWLRDKKLATPERRKLKRPDGLEIDYWLVKPPYLEGGFHYPILVMVHGGPASMWGAANPALWHELQYFAARGYAVVFANPRGSSGYGHKFQRAAFQDWGPGPAGDVLAVADAAAKENWADAGRQVIIGGSYGAYLATWIISTDTRFKAAIAARGVYDLTTFFGEGDAWPLVPRYFGGHPWQPEIRKLLDAQSPLNRVDSIHTPLLIKQNEADRHTGSAQGELLYRSLKLLDRPVELVRYPGASHHLSRSGDPAQRVDRLVRFDAFFQRFIGTPAQPIPPPPAVPASPPPPAPAPPAKAPAGEMMMTP